MKTKEQLMTIFFKTLGLLCLCLAISSCGSGQALSPTITPAPTNTLTSTPTLTPTSTHTPVPSSTTTPTPKPGAVIFSDTFDNNLNGWATSPAGSDSGVNWQVGKGKFSLEMTSPKYKTISFIPASLPPDVDSTFDVKVERNNAATAWFGAVCRWQDNNNYYQLYFISVKGQSGFFGIIKVTNGIATSLYKLTQYNGIPSGQTAYNVHVICSGNQLQLGLDGIVLATVTDNTLKTGRLAFYGQGDDKETKKITINFDNLIVKVPGPVSP